MNKTEKLSHYSIMVVAVSALVVSVWQVRTSQEHNKLSVRPYLYFFTSWNDGTWQVQMFNEGVGPAIITRVDYTYKGVTHHQIDDLLRAMDMMGKRINSTNFNGESPYSVGRASLFLHLDRSDSVHRKSLGVNVSVKYESIYEEPFELNLDF
ncbi:MAG: hypothetical protein HEP71_27360 [Roseivirga sp.]|nr:hypothetical protein [Roseivirga sp.]